MKKEDRKEEGEKTLVKKRKHARTRQDVEIDLNEIAQQFQ